MNQECTLLFVLFQLVLVYGYPGDMISVSPFEMGNAENYPLSPQFPTNRSPHRRQQPILHTNVDQAQTPYIPRSSAREPVFNSYIEDMNAMRSHQPVREKELPGDHIVRNSNDSVYRAYNTPLPLLSPPGFGSNQAYQKAASITFAPQPVLSKVESAKPDITSSLFKPITTKMNSKVSGLLSLILTLFSGSSPDGLQMGGIKDLVIDGIIKPLIVAKGGLKALISKLTIPFIALLLINLEVLVTVWWLWEDCEPEKPYFPAPDYSHQKPADNYNNYNSYR